MLELMACDWLISPIIWFFISTWHFHSELLYKGKCQKWDSTNGLCNAFKYDDGSKSCELAKVSSILCIKVKPWIEINKGRVKKKIHYGKFHTRGGGQRGSFSISNFLIFFAPNGLKIIFRH